MSQSDHSSTQQLYMVNTFPLIPPLSSNAEELIKENTLNISSIYSSRILPLSQIVDCTNKTKQLCKRKSKPNSTFQVYTCVYCTKIYSMSSSLFNHIKLKHESSLEPSKKLKIDQSKCARSFINTCSSSSSMKFFRREVPQQSYIILKRFMIEQPQAPIKVSNTPNTLFTLSSINYTWLMLAYMIIPLNTPTLSLSQFLRMVIQLPFILRVI